VGTNNTLTLVVSSKEEWRAPDWQAANAVSVIVKPNQQRLRVLAQALSHHMDHVAHQWRLRTVPEEQGQGNRHLTLLF